MTWLEMTMTAPAAGLGHDDFPLFRVASDRPTIMPLSTAAAKVMKQRSVDVAYEQPNYAHTSDVISKSAISQAEILQNSIPIGQKAKIATKTIATAILLLGSAKMVNCGERMSWASKTQSETGPAFRSGEQDRRGDSGETHLDPEILFRRASHDDLERYTPDMLALDRGPCGRGNCSRSGCRRRVTIEPVAGIDARRQPTFRSCPSPTATCRFSTNSIMGEVTSTHRDIHLAVHPILVIEAGKPANSSIRGGKERSRSRVSAISRSIFPR